MAERVLSPALYVGVLVVLVALTILTVGLSFMEASGLAHIVVGMMIAVTKASLVVLFFMHAVLSPRLTWVVIAVTIFWLIVVLVALTLSDYFTRGMLPYTPGH